jgi:hypothetical protein
VTNLSFNRRAVLAGASALSLAAASNAQAATKTKAKAATAAPTPATEAIWLDGTAPQAVEGVTFGVPWPRGALKKDTAFRLGDLAVQSWPIAYWPDGSLKWSAHAIAATDKLATSYPLTPGVPAAPAAGLKVDTTASGFTIGWGEAVWKVAKSGPALMTGATRAGKPVMGAVTLVVATQNGDIEETADLHRTDYRSEITSAVLEQSGPVRAVVKLDGVHTDGSRRWLPFSVRLYFTAGSEAVRMVHSFIFDGDPAKDFIRSLGVSVKAPMTDEMHNRHIRFSGQDGGVWGEAVRTILGPTGRDQAAGKKVAAAGRNLKDVPAWSEFSLTQASPDGFTLNKRTLPGQGWIQSSTGGRSTGLVYAGGAAGGVAVGMKDFWQRFPAQLDIRGAATDEATVTAWMWSPNARAMDMRSYRPVWGMDTYARQNDGLAATYEDYEPGYDSPYGIARTTELVLYAMETTPSHERFAAMAANNAKPPLLTVSPERLHMADIFGDWSLINTSTPTRALIEGKIAYQLDFYLKQIEQHHWYGFWTFGNIMHTQDPARHEWRYDIGGYAWDNSELQSDMFFWYGYLRSGRADVFRMAEAMTRQTGEVAVYHIGPWKGFGTRHGVQPFSDSSKQPRVSNAAFRRFYYYLTGDERTGDLMRELNDSDQTLQTIYIERKVGAAGGTGLNIRKPTPGTVDCSFGTSWGSFIAAWLTEWERSGDTQWRDRIVNGMKSIAALKYGWFCAGAPYDLKTHTFVGPGDKVEVIHLNAVFGVAEMHEELLKLVDVPAYRKTWLDYCKYYNAPDAEIKAFLGVAPRDRSLRDAHSRLTAYAARELKDPKLADRAWSEFLQGQGGRGGRQRLEIEGRLKRIFPPEVMNPVDEDPSISTNDTAQWGLAAIENLEIIGDTVEIYGPKYL